METYEHRQFSPLILAAALAPLALASLVRGGDEARRSRRLRAMAGTAIVALPFTLLITRVDENGISWAFGLGFPAGRVNFGDIAHIEITKTRFLEGFGIHWTPRHGWLWNAAGFDAVMIRKHDGRVVTLGTDDSQGLYDAIQRRLLK
jgi:hypothetical protein